MKAEAAIGAFLTLSVLTGCTAKDSGQTPKTPVTSSTLAPPTRFIPIPGSPFEGGYTIDQKIGCMSDGTHLEIVIVGERVIPVEPDNGITELYVGDYTHPGYGNLLVPTEVAKGTNKFSFILPGKIRDSRGSLDLLRGSSLATVIKQFGSPIDYRSVPTNFPC